MRGGFSWLQDPTKWYDMFNYVGDSDNWNWCGNGFACEESPLTCSCSTTKAHRYRLAESTLNRQQPKVSFWHFIVNMFSKKWSMLSIVCLYIQRILLLGIVWFFVYMSTYVMAGLNTSVESGPWVLPNEDVTSCNVHCTESSSFVPSV